MKTYELICTRTRKSFYGKAVVIEADNGKKYLKSYSTIVCSIDENGNFERFWGGYSATTMRHVNDFIYLFGVDGGGKKWWDELPIEKSDFNG